jgi:hypothetical protein
LRIARLELDGAFKIRDGTTGVTNAHPRLTRQHVQSCCIRIGWSGIEAACGYVLGSTESVSAQLLLCGIGERHGCARVIGTT